MSDYQSSMPAMRKVVLLCAAVLLMLPAAASAQRDQRSPGEFGGFTPAARFPTTGIQAALYRLPGLTEDYQIGPGDELEVLITPGFADKSLAVTVSNSGFVAIPLLGELQVGGLTAEQVEQRIAAAFAERQLLRDPEVLVTIAQYVAKPVYVTGQVDNPGEYLISQQLTIMDAIFLAGGLDFTADRYGYLHRRTKHEGPLAPSPSLLANPAVADAAHEVIKLDLQPLKEGKLLEQNSPVRRGDIIVVPKRAPALYYVIGAVVKAGPLEIPAERRFRLSQALAAAGGPTRTARAAEGILVRYDEAGGRQERPVDFNAILRGKAPDIEVRANDVIFVPGSEAKTLGFALLGAVPTMIQTAVLF